MKVLTRDVIILKSIEETTQILKSCAYHFPKATFTESTFSMHCPKRRNGGVLSLIHIKGSFFKDKENTKVILKIHANLYFAIGCLMIFGGLIGLIYSLLLDVISWPFYLGAILLGLLASGQFIGESSELLDLLEHKLTR